MSNPLKVKCPACKAQLKLPDRSKVGKRIACPKCKEPFVVKGPPESEEVELDDADMLEEDEEAEEEEDEVDERPKASSASKKKAAAKSSEGSNSGLLIAGIAAGLVVLGVLGVFVMRARSKPAEVLAAADPQAKAPAAPEVKNKLDLAYLPPDAELFVHFKPTETLESPFVKNVLANAGLRTFDSTVKNFTGAGLPPNLQSLTIGACGISSNTIPLTPFGVTPTNIKYILVLRFNHDIEAVGLQGEFKAEKIAYEPVEYYRPPTPPGKTEPDAYFMVGTRVVVYGPEVSIKEAIAQGEKATRRPELDFVPVDQHVLIALVPKDKAALFKSFPAPPAAVPQTAQLGAPRIPAAGALPPPQPGAPPIPPGGLPPTPNLAAVPPSPPGALPPSPIPSAAQPDPLQQALEKQAKAVCVGIKFGTGIDLQVAINTPDSDGAQELKKVAEGTLAEQRAAYEKIKSTLPAPLVQIADQLLGSLKFSDESSVVTFSTSIPEALRPQLEALPNALMGMMFGGMAGLGGTPNPLELAELEKAAAEAAATAAAIPAAKEPDDYERPGVPPSNKEGIPDGLTLQGKARWTLPNPEDEESNPDSTPLEVAIDLTGTLAAKIISFGHLKPKTITADGDTELKASKPTAPLKNAGSQFVAFDRDHPVYKHPKEGVRIRFFVPRPANTITKVTTFEGTFKIEMAQDSKAKILEKANDFINKSVTDPELKQAGFKLKVQKKGTELSATVNPKFRLGKFLAVDAAGAPIAGAVSSQGDGKGGPSQVVSFGDQKVPDGLTLKFTVYWNIQASVKPVSFKFENIPIKEAGEDLPSESSSATPPTQSASAAGIPKPGVGEPADKDESLKKGRFKN